MNDVYRLFLQGFQALGRKLQGGHLCLITGHRAPQIHYSGGIKGQTIPLLPEGKTFCQHCGEGIILQWVELRCSGCERPRLSRTCWDQIHPTEKSCVHCGESATWVKVLERPQVYQLHYAVLRVLTVENYLAQSVQTPVKPGATRAWLERMLLSTPSTVPPTYSSSA